VARFWPTLYFVMPISRDKFAHSFRLCTCRLWKIALFNAQVKWRCIRTSKRYHEILASYSAVTCRPSHKLTENTSLSRMSGQNLITQRQKNGGSWKRRRNETAYFTLSYKFGLLLGFSNRRCLRRGMGWPSLKASGKIIVLKLINEDFGHDVGK